MTAPTQIDVTAASTITGIDANPLRIHTRAGTFELVSLLDLAARMDTAPLARTVLGAASGWVTTAAAVADINYKLARGQAIDEARRNWGGPKAPTGFELKDWADGHPGLADMARAVAELRGIVATLDEFKWAMTAAAKLGQ